MKILVGQHELKIDKKDKVNQNEYKVTKCEFEFDEAITDDLVKIALFTNSAGTYKQYIVNNKCDIPAEILEKQETTTLGVYAYKEENEELKLRYSPEEIKFYISNGSYKENAQNTEPITPSDKEQMEQALQNGLNDINDKIDEVDDKLIEVNTAITETNNLNLDVSNKVDGDVTVTLTKKDASTKSVTLSDGTSLEFNWDGTKLGIKTSDEEEYTYVDLQGIQGPAGPQGEAFRIKKTYSSVAEMNADFNNMEYGDYVMIASSVEVEDNAKLYTRGESQWIFITDFSGATGIRGPVGATPSIQIGTVVSGATPSVTRTGTDENPILNFVLQKGDKGDKGNIGDTGNGISSIEKTSTSGLVDTYTITFTNGNTTTFDVSNGNGIDRIEKTATVGNIDTYTIYFNDNSTSTYEVANGEVTKEELQEEVDRLSMIYNAFPTTSDEDEEITLDGTAEVPFKKFDLKGNTSQNTTTGKNMLGLQDGTYSNNGITAVVIDGEITLNGTASAVAFVAIPLVNNYSLTNGEKYTISLNNSSTNASNVSFRIVASGTYDTPANEVNKIQTIIYDSQYEVLGNKVTVRTNSGTALTNLKMKPQIEAGNSATSWEKYTGNQPSPSPDYPQDVQVVSGDNTIKVEGKNLFDGTYVKLFTSGGSPYNCSYDNNVRSAIVKVKPNTTYTISKESSTRFRIGQYDEMPVLNLPSIKFNMVGDTLTNYTITTENKTEYLLIQLSNNNEEPLTQVELGNIPTTYTPYTSQTYPINLGSIELCKIGDYQDYIRKSSGKNLLNISDITSGNGITNNGDGTIILNGTITNTSFTLTNPITLKANKTYTLSLTNTYSNGSNSTFILRNGSTNIMTVYFKNKSSNAPFTPTQDTIIDTLRIFGDDVNFSNYTFSIQLEENNQYTSYEPYGKVWYIHKDIGKVVLDGSETYTGVWWDSSVPRKGARVDISNALYPTDASQDLAILGDKYTSYSQELLYRDTTFSNYVATGICIRANNSQLIIKNNNLTLSSETASGVAQAVKEWVTTNGLTVYYPLATPTITEITDTTLIEQLDNLENAYSYDTQTNITQTNDDMPFILDVEAILSLKNIFNS